MINEFISFILYEWFADSIRASSPSGLREQAGHWSTVVTSRSYIAGRMAIITAYPRSLPIWSVEKWQ